MVPRLKIPNHLTAIIWQLTRRLIALDRLVVDLILENICADSRLLISEYACVHEDLVGNGLTHLPTHAFLGHSTCSLYHLLFVLISLYDY